MEIFWITGRGAILKVSDRNKEYKVGESVEIKNRLYEITGIEGSIDGMHPLRSCEWKLNYNKLL